ncbi:MOSC domain-containing protein [Candidatus Binatus soli]|jgi:MOSC domain-containing protein|uniref:MOSC domain-containing protein n=1 Tax=Candidatus Binatus soli TaxID=1953413 RepID=UPI003D151E15
MARRMIGKVSALARYPVKSMLGEQLDELDFTERGAVGDRAYALREMVTRQIASAKKFPRLFEFRAAYDSEPASGRVAPVTIELPGGRKIHAEDADASELISAALGRKVSLERAATARGELAGIDPATLFADVPVEKVIPGLTAAMLPEYVALEKESFFDSAVMHVVASGTLRYMAKLAAPGPVFDPRRFRPTIFVDTGQRDDAFIEDEWIGGTLEVGDSLRIVAMQPALRCVMTTHPQDDLPRDYTILRTAAFHHRAYVGVFASIGAAGRVRLGDPVCLDQ